MCNDSIEIWLPVVGHEWSHEVSNQGKSEIARIACVITGEAF